MCHSVSHSVSLCPFIFTCKMFIAMTLALDSSQLSCCFPYPTALDQQDCPFYMSQSIADDLDLGVSHLRALELGLGNS